MKPSRLVSFLRNTFLWLEWIWLVLTVFMLVFGLILAPYQLGTPGTHFRAPIYSVKFDLQPQLPPLVYHGASAGTLELQNIRGDLAVAQAVGPANKLVNFVRMRTVSTCLLLGLACAIFSLLRRLLDNVKRGEAFSMKSVQYIRGIGWCFLTYAIAVSLTSSAFDWVIANDLRQHLAVGNIHTDFIAATPTDGFDFSFRQHHLFLDLNTLWIALLAFVLAEVFRQGVLLQQDHDLTV